MITRQIADNIKKRMFSKKAIILLGPRQVGKTTLIRTLIGDEDVLFLDGDDVTVRNTLSQINTQELKNLIGKNKIVFIDETQRIENIGLTAKIIVDQIKDIQLILSGSSSFQINEEVQEPLTGRKWSFELYPITFKEWENNVGVLQAKQGLNDRLIYGFYPDILNNPEDQTELIDELMDSYLFKDVLLYGKIKKSDSIFKLVQALAYQVGNEVNYNELSNLIGIDAKTVASYIDILEKAFVFFRLNSYSTNQRNEIKKGIKIYFFDNGVRNAIIKNFNNVDNRNDVGALWENFLISERWKQLHYSKSKATPYFWRTTQQQEIDYVEVSANEVKAFEFKWSNTKKGKISDTFTNQYHSINSIINKDNYHAFITMDH
ncbi:MAG TPA: ATP-binding protein [Saprospiraceae bacterium]|nr:ATP-binding protein [Saprospiraceae bacterium]